MIIIYNLVFYHTFGNREAIYICYVDSNFWVHIFRGNFNLKKKLSTQFLKKIKEFLLFDAWKIISPSVLKGFLESSDPYSDIKDVLWCVIFIRFIGTSVSYKKHIITLKL